MLWRGCQIDWHLAAVLHSIDYEAQHRRRRLKLAIKSANNNNIYQVLQHKLSSSSRVLQQNFYATKCKNLLMVEKGRIEFCNLKRSNWIFLKRPHHSLTLRLWDEVIIFLFIFCSKSTLKLCWPGVECIMRLRKNAAVY